MLCNPMRNIRMKCFVVYETVEKDLWFCGLRNSRDFVVYEIVEKDINNNKTEFKPSMVSTILV